LGGFLFDEFFAVFTILGVANEDVLERNELKWCNIAQFINIIATTVQVAKKKNSFLTKCICNVFTQGNAVDMLSVGRNL